MKKLIGGLIATFIFLFAPIFIPFSQVHAIKSSYTIAVYGDSFVDTMGENMDYLQASLKRRYPNIKFNLYNYGIGSQNVQMGLDRFDNPFDYQTRHYPSVSNLHPDIIVLGSFGYNPFYPYNRDQHWNTLTALVQKAQTTGAQVYVLAEIAPLKSGFGKGPGGVNWPPQFANTHAQHIIEQLENAIYLSKDHLKVPLIDAYHPSLADNKFGKAIYVNTNDGIHPSIAGHKLIARLIAANIKLY